MRIGLALAALIGLCGALVLGAAPARAADDPILCGRYIRAEKNAATESRVKELLANPVAAQCPETRGKLNAKLRAYAPSPPQIVAPAPAPQVPPPQIIDRRPPPQTPSADETAWRNAQAANSCEAYRGFVSLFGSSRFASEARRQRDRLCVSTSPPPPAPRVVQTRPAESSVAEPEMVRIPGGSFVMGSPAGEAGRGSDEGPQRTVTVRAFEAGKFEVSFADWDACAAGGGCRSNPTPSDQGWGRGRRPVINVSWNDAQEYVRWLNQKTGQRYRLLTEAEWEYTARGGRQSAYWWGGTASHDYANYGADSCCSGLASGRDQWVNTAPVGSFPENPFGLYDMHGNVWEWVEDCYAENYSAAPTDGSAFVNQSCSNRVFRGGSWGFNPTWLRSAYRDRGTPTYRGNSLGFRLARTL